MVDSKEWDAELRYADFIADEQDQTQREGEKTPGFILLVISLAV
jgi:hypothetical protein